MLSAKAKSFSKDILVVAAIFCALSGSYLTFAVAERYRALTAAYLQQAAELIKVLETQNAPQNQQQQLP